MSGGTTVSSRQKTRTVNAYFRMRKAEWSKTSKSRNRGPKELITDCDESALPPRSLEIGVCDLKDSYSADES